METTRQSPTFNEKKSLTSGKNTCHRGSDAQCPSFPSRQTVVQAKLELTTPGDSFEQEADLMADLVMRSAFSVSDGEGQQPQRTMSRPIVSRRSSGSGGVTVDSQTESGIMSSRGGGASLPTALRSRMETGFGADFSNVRIHNDSTAASLSNSIQAKAFTYGNDIYFNRGQYSPGSSDGQRLIAHELTHTLQQTGRIGRASDGEPENEEIEKFKEFTFENVINYDATDPYLKELVNFAIIIANKENHLSHFENLQSPLKVKSLRLGGVKGKHILFFHKKFFKNTDKIGNYYISDSIISSFLDYADLVSNGIEDKGYFDQSMVNKAIKNLTSNDNRIMGRGITIAIITDSDADYNGKYTRYNYSEKYIYEDDVYNDNSHFFILQGIDYLQGYISKIDRLVEFFGPLQNLIISGHGDWDRIILGKQLRLVVTTPEERAGEFLKLDNYANENSSEYFSFQQEYDNTLSFFREIKRIMNTSRTLLSKELNGKKPKQSVFLQACLTNAKRYTIVNSQMGKNFKETIESYLDNVTIIANSAEADTQDVDYDSKTGALEVIDSRDSTILKEHKDYKGNDFFYSRCYLLGNECWKKKSNNIQDIRRFQNHEIAKFKVKLSNTSNKFNDHYNVHLIDLLDKINNYIDLWVNEHNAKPNDGLITIQFNGKEHKDITNTVEELFLFIREIFYNAYLLKPYFTENNVAHDWKFVFEVARITTNTILYNDNAFAAFL